MTYKRSTDKAGGRTLRSKGSLFTGWTGRPMKPVARALRVFAASIFIGPFWPSAAPRPSSTAKLLRSLSQPGELRNSSRGVVPIDFES